MFPKLSLTVLFSVDFHSTSSIPLKSVMNIQFCCFFIFNSMRCLIFSLNFLFNFRYFSSIVYIWFYLLYYFDDSSTFIFLRFICYVFLYGLYSFYYYCLLIYIFCGLILCSQFFLLAFKWYPFLDFSLEFSLHPWYYFVLFLTIHHSLLELCLSLIPHLSAFMSICSYIFCIHFW